MHLHSGLIEEAKSHDNSIFKRILKKEKNAQWDPIARILTHKNDSYPLPSAFSEKRSHFIFFCGGFQLASRRRKELLSSGDNAKAKWTETEWRKLGHS